MGTKIDTPDKPAIIVDIDGTLVQTDTDIPIPHTVELVQKLAGKYKILICTFRKEKKRKETIKLLRKLGIPFDQLVMRPKTYNGDVEPWVYKSAVLNAYQQKYDVKFAVDDLERTNEAYRECGVDAYTPAQIEKKLSQLTKNSVLR